MFYLVYFNLNFTFYLTVLKTVKFENSKYKLQLPKCFIFTE